MDGVKCECYTGFTGNKCEFKECESNTKSQCQHDGKCRIRISTNQIECDCPQQYTGALCERTSCVGYCYNGATCDYSDTNKTLKCNCLSRFFGDRCQFDRCFEAKKCGSNCFMNYDEKSKQCTCLCGKDCDSSFCNSQGTCNTNANNLECMYVLEIWILVEI